MRQLNACVLAILVVQATCIRHANSPDDLEDVLPTSHAQEPVPGDLPPEDLMEVDKRQVKSMYKTCLQTHTPAVPRSNRTRRFDLKSVMQCPMQGHFNVLEDHVDASHVFKNVDLGDISSNSFIDSIGRRKKAVSHLDFKTHGVTVWNFDADFMRDLGELRRISLSNPQNSAEVEYMEDNVKDGDIGGGAADVVSRHLHKFLERKYNHPIQLVCSTSVKVRAASDQFAYNGSGHIPGNTLFHVDYASLESAFDRLHDPKKQGQWRNPTYAPEGGQLVDVVNLWAPVKIEPLIDWHLGFVLPEGIQGDFIGIDLVVDARAGTLRGRDIPGAAVYYKKDMAWGSGYVFKACAKRDEAGTNKTIPFHGSFRVFPPTRFERRSFEARCSVFRMPAHAT